MNETGAPATKPAQPSPESPTPPPDAAPPGAAQPAQPGAAERPSAAQPAQPGAAERPSAAQPATAQPATAQPSAAQPGAAERAARPSATQPGAAQPGAVPPFGSPPARLPRWLAIALSVVTVLLLCGVNGWFAGREWNHLTAGARAERNASPTANPFGGASSAPSAGPTPTGPRRATYPVRTAADLGKVCDGWFYPGSPKFAGKAPHPIAVGVVDATIQPHRLMLSSVQVPDLRESVWRAWMPEKPAKTQLVACVDLAKAGATLKTCKYNDAGPQTLSLKQGTYRLRLFETATGRKLLDKPVAGQDKKCPVIAFVAQGDFLYSQVEDKQLYTLLKGFVMKK